MWCPGIPARAFRGKGDVALQGIGVVAAKLISSA
jgi:hypothetical protein